MPFILVEGYRIGFYSNERDEPPHVHVIRGDNEAKFWLSPLRLAHNYGYNQRGIGKIAALIAGREAELLEMWHDHLG
jgi:Domain of unknown function (DUF4160)